jgi:hypothetical protein
LDEIWKKEEMKKELMGWFMPEEAYAGYLNNFVADMIIYSRANIGLDIDVDDGIATNGQQMKLWSVSSHHAQKFKFNDETGEIKFVANTNFCLDRGGNYDGARVQLYQCNGSWPQKWQAFPDGTIKA